MKHPEIHRGVIPRDPAVTSRIMAAIPSHSTRPELALRRALWTAGLRYRLASRLPGKPDLVFPSARLAVFVDGDFWHGNAWRIRGMSSFDEQFEGRANPAFWRAKITANMERDIRVNAELKALDWDTYRVFESRLRKEIVYVVTEISEVIATNKAALRPVDLERT